MTREGVAERVATLEARMEALEEAVRELTIELRNERRHLEMRVEELEKWRAGRNALAEHEARLRDASRQLWLALLSLLVTVLFSGGGLIAIAVRLIAS